MMSQEQNDLITRTGPKDPCGKLMRMYWQPAALVDELEGPRSVRPVKLLGEDLVLFRDEAGHYGLIERHCAHRGADLAFGRLEHSGLRCAFHGWLFDATGQCLETPAEPVSSPLCRNIRQPAYPVVEKSGVLWAYMGAGEAPAFPAFDCFVAPDAYTFAFKGLWECNWLQALEVGIDPDDRQEGHQVVEQAPYCAHPEASLDQGRRLDHDRAVGDGDDAGLDVVEQTADGRRRARMVRVVGVEDGVEG